MNLTMLALMLAAAAIVAAPLARADDTDTAYVAQLGLHGIPTDDPASLIYLGHLTCELLREGRTPSSIAAEIMGMAVQKNVVSMEDKYHADVLVGAAVGAYCLQYYGELGQ